MFLSRKSNRHPHELVEMLAKAIRHHDRTVVFENYSKQALAVLDCLQDNGYAVVPLVANPHMCDVGKECLVLGVHRQRKVAAAIYDAMVTAGRGK